MSQAEIIFIAIGLAMDAFAVAMGAAGAGTLRGKRAVFRISFHFGLFQFMMPVIGWYSGLQLAHMVQAFDHWIAFILLGFVGGRMVYEALDSYSPPPSSDPSRGRNLVILSLATSIDALAVGFSLAMLNLAIWYPSVIIGLITAGLSLAGIYIGKKLGQLIGRRMGFVGGLILISIGTKIVLEHTGVI